MKILAFLTDPPVSAILLHLDLPHKPPPLIPARGSAQSDLLTGLLEAVALRQDFHGTFIPDATTLQRYCRHDPRQADLSDRPER